MSQAIGLQCFRNGRISTFPRSIVWDIYGPKARLNNEGCGLYYDTGPSGCLYLDDYDPIDSFSIFRAGEAAIRDMYAVACQVPSLINLDDWPAVADASYLAGIPDWLLNALGHRTLVVGSADEFLESLVNRRQNKPRPPF
jgi:hypothetical protein